jgi:hypothetical protein
MLFKNRQTQIPTEKVVKRQESVKLPSLANTTRDAFMLLKDILLHAKSI